MLSDPDSLRELLVGSGIVSDSQFVNALQESRSSDTSATTQQILSQLLADGALTEYQAEHIKSSRSTELLVGDYVLCRPLQQGGMGQVFEAWHTTLQRTVAMKSVISRSLVDNPKLMDRFRRELQVCGRLNHKNIVTSHDAVILPAGAWLVMERLHGSDLQREVQKNGPLSATVALKAALHAARGLDHAHQHGVLHRDVKPSNLFLERDGNLRVLDFGLAVLRTDDDGAETDSGPLTESGLILGTASYMAPEQALGSRRGGERSDVYSLGCTLYYLLTGETPFQGATVLEQIIAHREAPVPSIPESRGSRAVNRLLQRMMSKSPELRQQTMAEVVDDLASLVDPATTIDYNSIVGDDDTRWPTFVERIQAASIPSRKRLYPRVLWVGVLLAVVVLVAAAIFMTRGPQPGRNSWEAVRVRILEANPEAAISADAYRFEGTSCILDLSGNPDLLKLVPFQSLPVDELNLNETSLSSLKPLGDAQLKALHIGGTRVTDLAPIKEMSLETFAAWQTRIHDIEPLTGMPLWYVDIHESGVTDLAPLAHSPLEELDIHGTQVSDLTPLANLSLLWIDITNTPVASLEPLTPCPLQRIYCDAEQLDGIDIRAAWPDLEEINDQTVDAFLREARATR